ncbi:hypothetical protein [Cupriavidus plantarum]|uniref:Uncharacterized protein n=1 Tax=Cupriavidus plantarum TaxID=942865 RepID=A0A316EMS9_9BURK|nr:hypothetical protein [Cupriavidus plantarum]PWK33429.1 hypothetical protein C7419_104102 [Cupriavidus plantarum]REE87635.1 hypothetical protein C7418_5134 [Cupriavidus plantarum]
MKDTTGSRPLRADGRAGRVIAAIATTLTVIAVLGAVSGCASRPDNSQSGISVYGVVDEGVSLTRDR